MTDATGTFTYDGGSVPPGESRHFKYEISQTYLSEPVNLPVSVINGSEPGPVAFLSAAVHGDELNGVEVVRHVADELDHGDLHGTLVCLHVVNVPGFNAQERYLPLDDSDLNRSFPGRPRGNAAHRIAHEVYRNFVAPCDFGIDLHTSTRGRTNLVHVRADLDDPDVRRVAMAFGSNVVLGESGPEGSLRRVATAAGIPTVTVEMGAANRFQRSLIDEGVAGVESVLAEFGLHPQRKVRWPGWRAIVEGDEERRWVRADVGGVVELSVVSGTVVREGDLLGTITNPFDRTLTSVRAPFTGLIVSTLQNPVVYPGGPLCHLVEVPGPTVAVLEARA